ncbi:Uncharacterised protein [Bordetella ansorpii]|uniref:Uncharacterized protein n=2 Tax=Bordetella ansorpii TaxID=288768 RepID=A0A157QRM3_9BORD|nr:Uncharacterised protein [Bordetella ansorpii]
MKTRPRPATPAQLARAYDVARLRGTLAEALRSPLLARCLELTAEALAADQPRPNDYRPPPVAPPPEPARPVSTRITNTPDNPPRRDVKRASAGDLDE